MKIFKKVVATTLAMVCSFGCVSSMSAFASENEFSSKIDQELKTKLEE